MKRSTQTRTLTVLLVLSALIGLNTLMQLLNTYSEWLAWVVYAIALLTVFYTLRFQGTLSSRAMTGVLAIPFIVVVLGALLGV